MMKSRFALMGLAGALALTGCQTTQNGSGSASGGMSQAQQGALIGAVAGALAGQAIGHNTKGTLIGAALGAGGGALIGNYMDKQAEELREVGQVVRVENGIVVTMGSGILFDTDSSEVKASANDELAKLARTLKKYPDTEIAVAGFTDSTGSSTHNQSLSERRANSVKLILIQNGVSGARVSAMGFGPARPVASNDTEAGRQKNRRVELHITPDEKLMERARKASG